MRNVLVVTFVAAALALLPAPRASAQEFGEAAAALAALAIMGVILSQKAHDDDRPDGRVATRRYPPPPRVAAPGIRPLPPRCEIRHGRDLYSERCLHDVGIRTSWLPAKCRVRFGQGRHGAIDAACLRREARWR